MRRQQMLSASQPESEGIRVFKGTGETMVIESGAHNSGLPAPGASGWSLPAGQYNPAAGMSYY